MSNSIKIESLNLANVSQWIDAAVASGANRVNSIMFSLSDKELEETNNMLLKQAVENATNKANIVASALGLKVIGVESLNINEFDTGYHPVVQPFSSQTRAQPGMSEPATPIISGEQQVTARVNVLFIIG